MNDWIPHALRTGQAEVRCKTCGSVAEFNSVGQVYECECRFGATTGALAFGLPGYTWRVKD